MKPCKHCGCSGIYIGPPIYDVPECTDGAFLYEPGTIYTSPCKYCNGIGWINEDEIVKITKL